MNEEIKLVAINPAESGAIDPYRWRPIAGSWRRGRTAQGSLGHIFAVGGAPLRSIFPEYLGESFNGDPDTGGLETLVTRTTGAINLNETARLSNSTRYHHATNANSGSTNLESGDENNFALGIRAVNHSLDRIAFELSTLLISINRQTLRHHPQSRTNHWLIGNYINQWRVFVDFTTENLPDPEQITSWGRAAGTGIGDVRGAINSTSHEHILEHTHSNSFLHRPITLTQTGLKEGGDPIYPYPHFGGNPGHNAISWRQRAEVRGLWTSIIPIDMRGRVTWARVELTGDGEIFEDATLFAYFEFDFQYRPMATRVGTQWHSLNRQNGFLQSRSTSGNWTDLPLLQYPNAPNMNATNNTNAQTPFPTEASSQSRGGSGTVWRQQSLIGSEE